ncbi:MAG: hypothetical protein ABII21_02740 [bacterium]
MDGIIQTKFAKQKSQEFEDLLNFFQLIKLNNKWEKFYVTPHVLTEICTHFRNTYRKYYCYKEIVEEIIPIIKAMGEKIVDKDSILSYVDFKAPVIEIGDISICLIADDFDSRNEKIAILANDDGINSKYQDNQHIMVMDFKSTIRNYS